jgi:two-component system nitrogen regulation sensor histidine kinase NtrY
MPRRPSFRDNTRLVLLSILGVLLVFLAIEAFLRQTQTFSPDFLASVLLYGLTVSNLTLLLVLVFVLGRNLVRALMERHRKILGARFRMRLVLVFLLMALAPSVLIVLVGSDLIRQTVDRWFNVDAERILSSSEALGTALHLAASERSRVHARALAQEIEARHLLEPAGERRLRRTVEIRARELEMDMVSVVSPRGELVAVVSPRLPSTASPGASPGQDPLAEAGLGGREGEGLLPIGSGELVRYVEPVRARGGGPVQGAVIVSTFLRGDLAAEAREIQAHYAKFQQAKAFKGPIIAFYLSFYFFAALLVLFGAVWLSLYLARRITTPLRLVAEGTERIASGERGVKVDFPAGDDEFAALIRSFNRMSERLALSEEEVEHTRAGLTRKNQELEERRRLTETVLETVGTGVMVVDSEGVTTAVNAAACRLLEIDASVVGRYLQEALVGPGQAEIAALVRRLLSGRGTRQERDVEIESQGRERSLAVTVVPLPRPGGPEGAVVVLDDLTPLLRAQKVAAWGEVARKLAHEIKNPLTPIQLSAQRIRKAHLKRDPDFERILTECTTSIVEEVDALKNLVDEFAQFARLPAANLVPSSLHDVIDDTLSLYEGLFSGVRIDRHLAPDVPTLRLDPEQMKRVLINLVDNAIEATEKKGKVTISTEFDRPQGRVLLGVADDGPGVAERDREKLFVPHFSTKKRGSGLGLAIVSRIVQEHHGVIRVENNPPGGARFVVELPA